MVVPLGPGKFYGSSLPRPRIYTDVKFSADRVDPPASVSDPFMSWASEAHWSMGGLSFKRFRLQGRIEGNVTKLRSQREKSLKKRNLQLSAAAAVKILHHSDDDNEEEEKDLSPSPPPAPIATKRRRFTAEMVDEEDGDWKGSGGRKRLARKLGKEFDRVAAAAAGERRGSPARNGSGGSETVGVRTRSRKVEEESAEFEKPSLKKVRRKLRRVGEIEEERAKRERESGSSKSAGGGGGGDGRVRTSPRLATR